MKKNMTLQITSIVAVVLVVVLIGGFLIADMLDVAEGSNIVIPTGPAVTTGADLRSEVWENQITLSGVKVTPENVAAVVATLARPESYTLTALVERSDGRENVQTQVTHAVHDGMTSTVSVRGSKTMRTLRVDGKVYLWDERQKVQSFTVDAVGEDAAAGLPDYSVVHSLKRITDAGYTDYEGYDCVFFAGFDEELNLQSRYYVDIASGLLIASETLCEGMTIYRMHTETIMVEMPDASLFMLPDGRSFMS